MPTPPLLPLLVGLTAAALLLFAGVLWAALGVSSAQDDLHGDA
jgi:hypothetical protein